MEGDTSRREETDPEGWHALTEPGDKGQSRRSASSLDAYSASSQVFHEAQQQLLPTAQAGEMPDTSSVLQVSSSSSKEKERVQRGSRDSMTDSTSHPAPPLGLLPPLNVRGGDVDDENPKSERVLKSMRTAALAVVSAGKLKEFRRSSAAMHVDLLRVFVPDMLINYLENASKPLESQAFFVKAACMCADISGFTALSEKHCKKGTAGLDTLVQIINSYYSNMVNIVYSFGGDIIKIAGDALYCVFMPDEHDLRGAVLCAALCSMQLREVAADGLTLHVGISCGELCFGILGGIDNYWECLMSGEPISLVADALDEAKKQEVVVSVECMSIIGDCCRGTPLPSRNVLLNALEPPRREKRGSIRMAHMIANKGLPVELEPTEGLFAGAEGAAAATAGPAATAAAAAAAAAAATAASMAAVAGSGVRGPADNGGTADENARQAAARAVAGAAEKAHGAISQTQPFATATISAAPSDGSGNAAIVESPRNRAEGVGPQKVIDANAAWYSSTAKPRERTAGRSSEPALGAAGKMRAEVSPRVLPMLQGFVPGPVTDLLAAGIFMYMAEMRTVTTLFVKLDSYSPEKHKNLLSLQIHLTTIQKILAEHEGFLRQFLVDDKGCVLIACWGVPGRSYPDNGNRCLAAAVEIHAGLQVRDMKTSMGITTGHALCGRMGGKIRSEYAMVGDVINLAARLMGKAKGRIVCDEATHDLVCSNESMVTLFKRLDPMMLKGKEHPISPFVCLAQQGSDMWETHKQMRMIGRMKLQESVNASLDLIDKGNNITNPEPAVVVIEGAQGTGKSMVADRVKKSASQFFRRKVHMYTMVQTLSGIPYAGAKGMLRTIFGLDHLGDDAFAIKQALMKTVREVYGSAEQATVEVAIRALQTVLGMDVGAETEEEILQPSKRPLVGKGLPLHVVHSVISELATHALGNLPAVFILDNVHLMDKMSWKLLIQLLKCPLRLLLVLTATPVEEDIKKRKNLFHAKKKNKLASPTTSKAGSTADGLNSVWHGDHGETHLHMQQYIRATQLPITKKFTLSPFTKEELRQLLQHTLAPQDRAGITKTLVDTVFGLSGGIPYWCVEVVRFIKENSVDIFMSRIAVEEAENGGGDGTSVFSCPEEAVMGRMGILVVCRFERLMVEEQSVVRYASIAGLEFSLSLLHAVLPRNIRPQLELIIQALVTAKFVVYSRHTYYKFRNSMVHMVLYNLTPASSRKRMHKAVAEHYIVNHAADPLYLPVMTYHLLQARVEPHQALKFVCKTAAHALVALCYDDCMEALEKAVQFVNSTSEIHAVLFVHHYISTMHQLGHTTVRNGGILGDTSEPFGRDAEDTSARAGTFQAQTDALGSRIARFKTLTEEPHSRLCSAGQFCPTLQGTFPSPRQLAADDAHADSLRKHPSPLSSRDTRDALPSAGGACDDFEEHVEMLRAEREDALCEGDTPGQVSDVKPFSPERESRVNSHLTPISYLRGDGDETPPLHNSLGWELAHLLHVCLGQYLKPGGASPGCPEAAEGTYSISTHRLPPEAGEGGEFLSEVSSAALLLTEHGTSRKHPSPSTCLQSTASNFRRRVAGKLHQASKLSLYLRVSRDDSNTVTGNDIGQRTGPARGTRLEPLSSSLGPGTATADALPPMGGDNRGGRIAKGGGRGAAYGGDNTGSMTASPGTRNATWTSSICVVS